MLALAGFVVGLVLSEGLYRLISHLAKLPIEMTSGRVGWVLVMTLAMCIASGWAATRKVRKADPADLF